LGPFARGQILQFVQGLGLRLHAKRLTSIPHARSQLKGLALASLPFELCNQEYFFAGMCCHGRPFLQNETRETFCKQSSIGNSSDRMTDRGFKHENPEIQRG
jgi:hypothetical protein